MSLNASDREILDLISKYDGISRKQLAEFTSLSPGSITNITRRLLNDSWIIEGTRINHGKGRSEVMLTSNPEKFYFLGIDIGGYYLRYAITNNNFEILFDEEIAIATLKGDKGEAILNQILLFLQKNKLPLSLISAIGIGVTGLVNSSKDTIMNIPNLEGWDHTEIVRIMKQRFTCPVYLDEGGRVMALAEQELGKAKEQKDFIIVHVGHGLVAGIITNGELMRGSSNLAGLMGHITVDENAGRCLCGNYGCLENMITYPMLADEYLKRSGDFDTIKEAFQRKDKIAIDVCMDAGKALGIALSNVINLFNPQAIYVGGKIFIDLPVLFEEMNRTIQIRANRFAIQELQLDYSSFMLKQGVIGASVLAKKQFISSMTLT